MPRRYVFFTGLVGVSGEREDADSDQPDRRVDLDTAEEGSGGRAHDSGSRVGTSTVRERVKVRNGRSLIFKVTVRPR